MITPSVSHLEYSFDQVNFKDYTDKIDFGKQIYIYLRIKNHDTVFGSDTLQFTIKYNLDQVSKGVFTFSGLHKNCLIIPNVDSELVANIRYSIDGGKTYYETNQFITPINDDLLNKLSSKGILYQVNNGPIQKITLRKRDVKLEIKYDQATGKVDTTNLILLYSVDGENYLPYTNETDLSAFDQVYFKQAAENDLLPSDPILVTLKKPATNKHKTSNLVGWVVAGAVVVIVGLIVVTALLVIKQKKKQHN